MGAQRGAKGSEWALQRPFLRTGNRNRLTALPTTRASVITARSPVYHSICAVGHGLRRLRSQLQIRVVCGYDGTLGDPDPTRMDRLRHRWQVRGSVQWATRIRRFRLSTVTPLPRLGMTCWGSVCPKSTPKVTGRPGGNRRSRP